MNLASERAFVTYQPDRVARAQLEQAIIDSGYGVIPLLNEDTEKQQRETEIRSVRNRFWLSLGFGIPLLYVAMGHHVHLPLPQLPAASRPWFSSCLPRR